MPTKPPADAQPDRLQVSTVPLDSLHEDPANARLHDERNLRAITASLKQFGQVEPLISQASTGKVIGGNGRLQAMRALGWQQAKVNVLDIDDVQATALGLALNRTAELAEWDQDALVRLGESLKDSDIDLQSMSLDAESLMNELNKSAQDIDENSGSDTGAPESIDDNVPDPPQEAATRKGDIWLLGKHRLLCADSADASAVAYLFGEEKADMIFCDPPYNVAEKSKGVAQTIRKSMKDLMDSAWDKNFDFLKAADVMLSFLSQDASVYICSSHHTAPVIWAWMRQWSSLNGYCVWSKTNPMPSLSKRHWTWMAEIICYGTRGKHTFNFPEQGHAHGVWSQSSVHKCEFHPTMKPVSIPRHAIIHSSNQGDLVADFFAGAGSTLLACETVDRKAYCCEIEPKYCDVIVRRWEDLTGKKAILQGDPR